MRFILFLTISTSLLSLFEGKENKKDVKYFEGVISYSVNTQVNIQNKYSDYLSQKYGTQMNFFWNQNGDLLRVTTGNKAGLDYALYKQKENMSYMKFRNVDTLYYYSSSENMDRIIEIKKGPNDTILNQESQSLTFLIESFHQQDTFKMHYYYSEKPHIDKRLFSNLKDGFANIVYEKTESPFMRMILDFNTHVVTYEATGILEKKINDDTFDIPQAISQKKV